MATQKSKLEQMFGDVQFEDFQDCEAGGMLALIEARQTAFAQLSAKQKAINSKVRYVPMTKAKAIELIKAIHAKGGRINAE